ncbi:MAG TPA: amino acid permease [Thermoleophilaceae bacterium]|jgi:APA family basic amino acid/polyamine antiporter
MATVATPGPFSTKPSEELIEVSEKSGLRKAVGALDLTALGIGAIIGTGIFVIIGEGITDSGPAIVISFVLAGVTCVFSALCYAELASALPVSGSAYTYAYATMGELLAWIIGWDLILEYGVSVAAISVGWGAYFVQLLESVFGTTLSDAITLPPGDGGKVNIPAVAVVLGVAALLVAGVRQSARTNTVLVITKIAVLLFFIVVALSAFNGDHFSNFAPNGWSGIESAAALIFFAYIGFDAVSTGSEECRRPQRDLPIAIIGSLVIATVLYILVSVAAVGALDPSKLAGDDAPLATALSEGAGITWGADVVAFGGVVAITSVVITILFGQTRVAFSMCRDGLLPQRLGTVWERTQTPVLLTVLFAVPIAVLAALVPLTEIAQLVNIGTLFAFLIVNIAVIWLRRTKPEMERGFRVPFVPVFPMIGAALCIYLMTKLPGETWLRFGVWLALGLVLYAAYGFRHSKLRT